MPVAVLAPGYRQTPRQRIIQRMAARLEKDGYTVEAVDFSVRSRPSKEFAAEFADIRSARADLLAAKPGPLVFVGRSFGARVCTRLAVLEPPAALVLLGHPVSPANRPRPEDEAALAAIRCPTFIVQGDHDPLGPLEVLQRIAKQNRHVELYVLPRTGHSFGSREQEGIDQAADWLQRIVKP